MQKGRQATIVDTNVPVTANRRDGGSYENASACAAELMAIRERGYLLVDDQDLIVAEYKTYLNYRGQPGAGDAFFRWFFCNRWKADLCRTVHIQPIIHEWCQFEEFPQDAALKDFDPSDQKFVATAISSKADAHILEATDHKWLKWHECLKKYGVVVRFICIEQLQATMKRKAR